MGIIIVRIIQDVQISKGQVIRAILYFLFLVNSHHFRYTVFPLNMAPGAKTNFWRGAQFHVHF